MFCYFQNTKVWILNNKRTEFRLGTTNFSRDNLHCIQMRISYADARILEKNIYFNFKSLCSINIFLVRYWSTKKAILIMYISSVLLIACGTASSFWSESESHHVILIPESATIYHHLRQMSTSCALTNNTHNKKNLNALLLNSIFLPPFIWAPTPQFSTTNCWL